LIELLLRYRKTFLGLVAVLTVLSFWGISKSRMGTFTRVSPPDTDPVIIANQMIGDRFGGMENIVFLVEAEDILSLPAIRVLRQITEQTKTLPGVMNKNDVVSLVELALPRVLKYGIEVAPLVSADYQALPEQRRSLDRAISETPLAQGSLVNQARTAALVLAPIGTRAYPDPIFADAEVLKAHLSSVEAILAEANRTPGVKAYATGSMLVSEIVQTEIKKEFVLVIGISLVLLLLIFYLNMPTWLGTLLPFGVTVFALVWTFGILGFLGFEITVGSIYGAILMIAVGSSYAIHALAHIQEETRKAEVHRVAVHLGWYQFSIPIYTVSLASVLGSLSLLTFELRDIRDLGLVQAIGVTISFILAFLAVPPIALKWMTPGTRHRPIIEDQPKLKFLNQWMQTSLDRLSWVAVKHPAIAVALLVAVSTLSYFGVRQVDANWTPEESVPHTAIPYIGYKKAKELFDGIRTAQVIVQAPNGESFFDVGGLQALQKIEASLSGIDGVQVYPGLATVFSTMNRLMTGSDSLPKTKSEVDQNLLLVGKRKLARFVDRSGSYALISLKLIDRGTTAVNNAVHQVKERLNAAAAPGYIVGLAGPQPLYMSINRYMVDNKIESILLCLLIVFVLCTLIQGSAKVGLIAMTPAALAAVATFALMGFAGITLDLATATTTTVAVSVGVDFAIHYVIRVRHDLQLYLFEAGSPESASRSDFAKVLMVTTHQYGRTILFDALSNLVGLSALAISVFPPLRNCGILLVFNQFAVIVATFFLTPLLIYLFKPNLLSVHRRPIQSLARST